jgi:hypothetical protein
MEKDTKPNPRLLHSELSEKIIGVQAFIFREHKEIGKDLPDEFLKKSV